MGRLHQWAFGITPDQTTFAKRGFRTADAAVRNRLQRVGHVFIGGYEAALKDDHPETLAQQLNRVELDVQGFAFEGAALGLALLDQLTPWTRHRRLQQFVIGPGANHIYMVHVGVGWAIARLPWLRLNAMRSLERLHPLLRWLALDGYGFHEGYFHWKHYLTKGHKPARLSAYGRRVFDQGLGRSLWFVDGADPNRIPATIEAMEPERRADLWSGVGLACAYAGGLSEAGIAALKKNASQYAPQLAQGAAFAAKTRQLARNNAEHTELACRILCSVTSDAAALITDEALEQLNPNGAEPAYEIWRKAIQTRFAEEVLR